MTTAENGLKCLEELEKGFKGVILMDITMPELNGWDTIERIVSKDLMAGNVICAFTTKNITDEEKMQNMRAHVSEFMNKPVDTNRLIEIVKKYSS